MSGEHPGETCPICLEELEPDMVYLGWTETACCHKWFHEDCLAKWLSINKECPLCRSHTPNKQEDEEFDGALPMAPGQFRGALLGAQDVFLTQTYAMSFFRNSYERPPQPAYQEDEQDVQLVSQQARCSVESARAMLQRLHGDIVNAIMELSP